MEVGFAVMDFIVEVLLLQPATPHLEFMLHMPVDVIAHFLQIIHEIGK